MNNSNKKEKLHKIDGPAKVWPNGDKSWWVNGKYCRLDGPGYLSADNSKKEYWIDGLNVSSIDDLFFHISIKFYQVIKK